MEENGGELTLLRRLVSRAELHTLGTAPGMLIIPTRHDPRPSLWAPPQNKSHTIRGRPRAGSRKMPLCTAASSVPWSQNSTTMCTCMAREEGAVPASLEEPAGGRGVSS